jgi:hypothetical protein
MSRLRQLQHLRLVDCFDLCTDCSLGVALATLTGTLLIQIPITSQWLTAWLTVNALEVCIRLAETSRLRAISNVCVPYLTPLLMVLSPCRCRPASAGNFGEAHGSVHDRGHCTA